MSWDDSRRRSELPANWSTEIVPRIKKRDGNRCTWITRNGHRCAETTHLEVDHIGDKHDHSDGNLRTLCHYHHKQRTAQQSAAARRPPSQRRPPEKHPGLRSK
jgi:5-methylcytosine-specific restriction protein A